MLAALFFYPSVVKGQDFRTIPSLYFTKTFAGVDPLPQIITVTSTGAQFAYTASATTSTGGNWLSYSGLYNGNTTGTTPTPITVVVSPAANLQAGTYSGQITLVSGSKTLTVTVYLTIVAPGSVYFGSLPGELTFSFNTNGTAPPAQNLQVRNAISGSLPWTLSTSTSDGGNWLVSSVPSGSAPTTLSISIAKLNLPGNGNTAGTFTGQLKFLSATGNVTVPVSVTVDPNAFFQVNPLNFTKVFAGSNPPPQIVAVSTISSAVTFTAKPYTSIGNSWFSISGLYNGNTTGTTPQIITIAITADVTLSAGTYTGEIVIVGNGTSMLIPVSLTVASASDTGFDNTAGQLSFSLKRSLSSVNCQSVSIFSVGPATLPWTLTATTADSGNWLSVSSVSGVAPSGPISVCVSVPNLPYSGYISGTYIGQLLFQSSSQSITVPISVAVYDNVLNQVSPLYFTKVYQGADPLPQVVTIATVSSSLAFTAAAYTGNGGNWLSYSGLYNGNTTGATPRSFTISANPSSSLGPGSYTGEVVVISGGLSMSIPVVLTITSASSNSFNNLPGQISFFMKTGAGNPPTQPLQIRNAGPGTLNWSLALNTSDTNSWLVASSVSGTAQSDIAIGVIAANLPYGGAVAGNFTGMINLQSSSGNVSIPVSVVVGTSVFVQQNPLNFSKTVTGTVSNAQSVTVLSTGTNFSFTAASYTGNGGNWLSYTGLYNGNTAGTTPQTFTVTATPGSLPIGIYTGEIVLISSDGAQSMTIPVTLTVGPHVNVGTLNNGVWALDANGNSQWDGPPADKFFFLSGPQAGDIAVVGDWNGDGRSKAGIYRNGFWILDYNGDGVYNVDGTASGDKLYGFGGDASQYVPIVGDWNGDGRTKIGFYSNGFWGLDYNGDGSFNTGDKFYAYGGNGAGEIPLIGDWNHNGKSKIGWFYRGLFVLDTNGDGVYNTGDKYYNYLTYSTGDKPVVGDWSGDGSDKIGLYRNGFWILDWNGNGVYDWDGSAAKDHFYGLGGIPGEKPIVGDWNGDGKTKVGVYINGFWILDYNGNGQWDGLSLDRFVALGGVPGEQPVVGRW